MGSKDLNAGRVEQLARRIERIADRHHLMDESSLRADVAYLRELAESLSHPKHTAGPCYVMLAARNPLGLLSEDTHPVTGEMWGNFPQTYSMVGLINAAVRLSAPWDTVI